jgi:hypothetical protein
VNPDLSRVPTGVVAGTAAAAHDDPTGLPNSAGINDWLRGAALVVLSGGNAHYNRLPTITRSADVKRCPASADPLAENDCGGHTVAFELDNGRPSCQAGSATFWCGASPLPQLDPGRSSDRGFSYGQRSTLPDPFVNAPPCADDDVK